MKNYFSTFNKHPHHNFNNIFKTFLTVSNIFFKHALLYFARQVFIRYQSLELIRARARKKEKKGPTVPGTKCEEPIVFVEIFLLGPEHESARAQRSLARSARNLLFL